MDGTHKRLPDTPWHVGYAKKDEDDPRRHKGRCIYFIKKCTMPKSPYYMRECGGSAHCMSYSEGGQNEWIRRAELLCKKLPRYFWDNSLFAVCDCPICGYQIVLIDYNPQKRFCPFCKALYVSHKEWKRMRDHVCFPLETKVTDRQSLLKQLQTLPLKEQKINWSRLEDLPDYWKDPLAYKSFKLI